MSIKPSFLRVRHLLALSERMALRFGGDASVRDRGLLESAAKLPSSSFAGKWLHETLPAIAAAYLFHLSRNRPFEGGNQRTSLAVAETFLHLNGMELAAADVELEELTQGVAAGLISKVELTAFFEAHTISIPEH